MKKVFLLLTASLGLFSCTENSNTITKIPNVEMTCATSPCQSAQNSGSKDAYVIITLSGCAPDQVDLDAVASGSTTASCLSSVSCTGTVSSWRDRNGNAITEMISTSYYICSRINFDNTIGASSGDEYSEVRKYIISDDPVIAGNSSWGVDYFSRSGNND